MATPAATPSLSIRHLARVRGWGMAVDGISHLYKPESAEDIRAVFDLARREGRTVALRGGGNSYGDAAINEGGIVLDLWKMDRILGWDPQTGVIDLEPGVTIRKLWQHTIGDGWWPPVVSGTMLTTMGGCAAMNIHGKNNYKVGPFGNHILEFDLLTPGGEVLTCSGQKNADIFHGAIGGFGMLGVFTRIRLQLKRIHSGLLRVEAFNTRSLGEMVRSFEERVAESDYLVGWVDCITGRIGRGVVHSARYLEEGEDPEPGALLSPASQGLPSRILGVFPKSLMHLMLAPFCNNLGMRAVNASKYYAGFLRPRSQVVQQTHAQFAFLLDYVPNWKFAYKPGGLIQYQSFIPAANAVAAFEELISLSRRAGLPSYLGVFKKHRPDPFLLTHAVDGYSLAMDFKVTAKNRERLWSLAADMDEVVLANGGRFYFAKDATLRADIVRRFLPAENLDKFARLKERLDPENLLQTNLSRRLFGTQLAANILGSQP